MRNMFYIFKLKKDKETEEREGERWLLRIKDTHFTMSALNSKEEILESLYNIVLRYKNKNTLLRRLHQMEKDNEYRMQSRKNHLGGTVNKETLQRWQEEYESSLEYREEVLLTVSKALEEVKPVNSIKKRAKVLTPKNTIKEREVEKKEVVEEVATVKIKAAPKMKRFKVNK